MLLLHVDLFSDWRRSEIWKAPEPVGARKRDIVTTKTGKRKNPPGEEKKDPRSEQTTPDPQITAGPDYGARDGNLGCKGVISQGFWCLGSLSGGTPLELSRFAHRRWNKLRFLF